MEMIRFTFDIGIGSVGWAVIMKREGEKPYIEDFGVRIFDSGENTRDRKSMCQERREHRSVRRLERRRQYRRVLLKNHWSIIGMVNPSFEDEMADCKDSDVYELKVKGLDTKLNNAELFRCLIHTCNHRGYKDFYYSGDDAESFDDESNDEEGKNLEAMTQFSKQFTASGCRTVSEYLNKTAKEGNFVNYRNRKGIDRYTLIDRDLLKAEVVTLLTAQSRFYPQLTGQAIDATVGIIFNQRDFEDGPGDKNDASRRYHGFLETLGVCPFYKDEKRGFRGTVLADVYAVTNTLSQYHFINKSTGEFDLPREAARDMVASLLLDAYITKSTISAILKKYGCVMQIPANADNTALSKSVSFLKTAKKCVELADLNWNECIAGYLDGTAFDGECYGAESTEAPMLHKIGECLSRYVTPRRRNDEMRAMGIPDALIKAFSRMKTGGTAAVSYRYMCDSISAFLNGDIYGNFQASFLKQQEQDTPSERYIKLPPSCIDDADMKSNRVVFKAVNETRKILNALVERYGSPSDIVVEVADELGRSFDSRAEETKYQRQRRKEKDDLKVHVAELAGINEDDVTADMMDRYTLYEEQNHLSLYSSQKLSANDDVREIILNPGKKYEIDHIVPYSLILDNTLNNKALVFASENQAKKQRTPLMYIASADRKAYLTRVQQMYSRKVNPISKKKYQYLKLDSLTSPEARELLDEWKSRNINDTRYITKYIIGILKRHLIFAEDGSGKTERVFAVKGAVTSKFRREWFRDSEWGDEEKNRETYLNHALDAVVIGNLTRPYIEIGSDAIRLRTIWKKHDRKPSPEYDEYLDSCLRKMEKYYGFKPEYTRDLLTHKGRTPSFIPKLEAEVKVRFSEYESQEKFDEAVKTYYPHTRFVHTPHMPITSMKQTSKFVGQIADSNPLKIVCIDGDYYKISRKLIRDIKPEDLGKLHTTDASLISTLTRIFGVSSGNSDIEADAEKSADTAASRYKTIGQYMDDQQLKQFVTDAGQPVRMVSLKEIISNFYRVQKSGDNYENLGGTKYYCVEIYRTLSGKTGMRGVRFVDMVHKGGKLWMKPESLPDDYGTHMIYLQKNDYIRLITTRGIVKVEGFYQCVNAITRNQVIIYSANDNSQSSRKKPFTIGQTDLIVKYNISILGDRGGQIKCSEPYPLLKEKN